MTGGEGGDIERSLGGGGERGAKFVSEFDGKKLDRFERASECGGGGIPKGRTVLKVRAYEGGVEVEDGDRRGVAVEVTKDEA